MAVLSSVALTLDIDLLEGEWPLVARGTPILSSPSDAEEQLTRIAVAAFPLAQQVAREFFPSIETEPHLAVEEGSVRLSAKIVAGAYALYLGIGNYGDFVSGVQILRRQGRQAADYVVHHVPEALRVPREIVRDEHRNRTFADELDSIFTQLEEGKITSREARQRAEALLRGEHAPRELKDVIEFHINALAHPIDVGGATAIRVATPRLRVHDPKRPKPTKRRARDLPREALPSNEESGKRRRRGVELWQPPADRVRFRIY